MPTQKPSTEHAEVVRVDPSQSGQQDHSATIGDGLGLTALAGEPGDLLAVVDEDALDDPPCERCHRGEEGV